MAGGAAPRRSGARYENDLAARLWEKGFAVVRGPSSGAGAVKRFQPDLVAMKRGRILVIEVKVRSRREPVYIERERVDALREFARRAGGIPLLAVKVKGEEWRFYTLDMASETRSGSLRVVAGEGGLRLWELESLVSGVRRLTDYVDEGGES